MRASPSETASQGFATRRPGARTPEPYRAAAAVKSAPGLNENRYSTSSVSRSAPLKSSTAFTICTQVVAIIPPKST